MAPRSQPNPFAIIGTVLLVFGGVGFVYGQATLQSQSDSVESGGAMLDVSVTGERDVDAGSAQWDESRAIRLLGIAFGAVGTVMALTGSMSGGRDTPR